MMSTRNRTQVDPIFKQILVSLGKQFHFTPRTEVEVSRLPRTIDAVIELPDFADQVRLTEDTSFIRLRGHNQIEFKGKGDPLYRAGYQLIRGRTLFYLSEHELGAEQMSVSVVCAGKPSKLLQLAEFGFQSIEAGYYLSHEHPPTLLIVVNELPLIPKHYPLLLFASSKQRFRELLQVILADSRYHSYLQYAYIVRPTVTKEVIMLGDSAYITDENLRFILEDVGERLMTLADPVLIQKSPAYQTLLRAEQEKQQQRLLEFERVKQQALQAEQEKQRALQAEQEKQKRLLQAEQEKQRVLLQQAQQHLLRLLQHRFNDTPQSLVERIEKSTDLEQLEQWLDNAFTVNSMAEFEASLPHQAE